MVSSPRLSCFTKWRLPLGEAKKNLLLCLYGVVVVVVEELAVTAVSK